VADEEAALGAFRIQFRKAVGLYVNDLAADAARKVTSLLKDRKGDDTWGSAALTIVVEAMSKEESAGAQRTLADLVVELVRGAEPLVTRATLFSTMLSCTSSSAPMVALTVNKLLEKTLGASDVPSELREALRGAGSPLDGDQVGSGGGDGGDAGEALKALVSDVLVAGGKGKELAAAARTRTRSCPFSLRELASGFMAAVLEKAAASGQLTAEAPWAAATEYGALLRPLCGGDAEAGADALVQVQEAVAKAGWPAGVLRGTFHTLFTSEIVGYDSVEVFRASESDAASRAKAMEELKSWFALLEDAEDEDEEDDGW
jgi:hypothetical protein